MTRSMGAFPVDGRRRQDATRRSQGRGRTSGVSFLSGGGAASLFLGFFFGLGALGVLGSRAIATHRRPPHRRVFLVDPELFAQQVARVLRDSYVYEIDK